MPSSTTVFLVEQYCHTYVCSILLFISSTNFKCAGLSVQQDDLRTTYTYCNKFETFGDDKIDKTFENVSSILVLSWRVSGYNFMSELKISLIVSHALCWEDKFMVKREGA